MIPIFIITCDRLTLLKKTMHSYRKQIKTLFEIVILDQGTTYPATVKYLKWMESAGVKVYRWKNNPNDGIKPNAKRDESNVRDHILDYFKTHPASNYVVTDPDILLDKVNGDILEVYAYLLKKMSKIAVVGTMLRIDDIPDYFPLKKELLNGKKGLHRNLHLRRRHTITFRGKKIQYIYAPIDTTFAMNRAGTQWRRLQPGVRTFHPYSARHLDWYINPKAIPPDQQYYMNCASANNHWSRWGRKEKPVEKVAEKALRIKWKPYGTKEPSTIPKAADEVLGEFFQIVKELKVRACLAFGLCLGFVRDKDYIPGDNDLDLVMLGKTGMLTPDIAKVFRKHGFTRKTGYPPPSNNVHFIKKNILLDIYFRQTGEYYKRLGLVKRNGIIYPIPYPTDEYLTKCYGDWRKKGTISARYR